MSWSWSFVPLTSITLDGCGAAWIGDKFVAMSFNDGNAGSSVDGPTWVQRSAAAARWAGRIAVNGSGLACAVSFVGGKSATTPDGVTWTDYSFAITGRSVAWGNGVFVAVGGSTNVGVSADGGASGWAYNASGATSGSNFYDIDFSPSLGRFCAILSSSYSVCTCDDAGATWTFWNGVIPGFTTSASKIVWNAALGLFIAMSANGEIATSPTGTNDWTSRGALDSGLLDGNWYNLQVAGADTIAFHDDSHVAALSSDGFATFSLIDTTAPDGSGYYWYGTATDGAGTMVVMSTQAVLVGTLGAGGFVVQPDANKPIVFAPLVDSPETLGDLELGVPKLHFRASSVPSSLVAELPHVSFAATGAEHQRAALSMRLPPLALDVSSVALAPFITVGGPLTMRLPMLDLIMAETDALAPQRGDALFGIPNLEFDLTDTQHQRGALVFALPSLDMWVFDSAGPHLVMRLPAVTAHMADAVAAPRNFLSLQAQPIASVLASNSLVIHDNVQMADVTTDELLFVLRDRMQLSASPTMLGHFTMALESSVAARDFLRFVIEAAIHDTVTLTETQTITPSAVLALASLLQVQDSALGTMNVLATIVSGLVLADRIRQDATVSLESGVALADLITANLTLITTIVEQALLADSLAGSTLTAIGLVSSEMAVTDGFTGLLTALMELEDGAGFAVRFRTPDGDTYAGYAVNLRNAAVAELTQHDFNSFATAKRGGRELTLAAKPGGIFGFGGDTFAGTPIDARVRLGLSDFGTSQLKRITNAFIGYTSDGKLRLKVVTTDGGRKKENWYALKARSADAPVDGRFDIAKGLVARYWGFEVENIDGADFQLDELKVLPMVLTRRKSGR